MTSEARYFTTAQVGALLQISPDTIVRYCREGELGHVKAERQYRIPEDALETFLLERSYPRSESEDERLAHIRRMIARFLDEDHAI